MKKILSYIGIGVTTILFGGSMVYAIGVTVPQSTAPGQTLVATTSGNYTWTNFVTYSTTTGNFSAPQFNSTTGTSTFLNGINIAGGCLEIGGSCISISGTGTVTSVSGSGGTTGLTLTGGPITTSGTLTLGGTLAVINGGTGITSVGASSTVLTTNGSVTQWNKLATSQLTNDSGFTNFSYPFPAAATSTNINFSGGITGALTGNSSTATALAANGTNCSAGNYPLGVDASGNSESCTAASTGTVTGVTATWPVASSGGAAPVISWSGLATSSGLTAGKIHYSTGVNTFSDTATTTASCAGTVSCTAFTVIGASPVTLTGSGGGTGSGNVATSTSETAGNLAYWTSNSATPATLGKVSTSTLSASSPLTGSLVQIGSGGSLGIQAASGSQNGYFASADFSLLHTATTTFTSPLVYTQSTNAVTCSTCTTGGVTSVTASAPLFSSGGATPNITWAGLATSSQPSSSNLLVSNGGSGVYGVATGTLSATGPITVTAGQSVIGTGATVACTTASSGVAGCLSNTAFDTFNNKQATISVTWPITLTGALIGFNGLSTSTAAVSGNIPYFSGVNTFANVATTTVSCSGSTSCTSFVAIGGSPITITSSGGGSSYPFNVTGNATSTLTQFNGGLTAYASSTIGNGTQAGGLTISGGATTTGNLQVGTGSAVALAVDPTTGYVGVATSSPYSMLSVAGQVVGANYVATTTASSTFAGGIDAARVCLTGTTTCLGGSTSTGRPILAFGATSTTALVAVKAFATTTISAGQTIQIWMSVDDQLGSQNYYLDVGNPGGGTTTLSVLQSAATAAFDPVTLIGQYTSTTTGTVFMAADTSAGTNICKACIFPTTNYIIF